MNFSTACPCWRISIARFTFNMKRSLSRGVIKSLPLSLSDHSRRTTALVFSAILISEPPSWPVQGERSSSTRDRYSNIRCYLRCARIVNSLIDLSSPFVQPARELRHKCLSSKCLWLAGILNYVHTRKDHKVSGLTWETIPTTDIGVQFNWSLHCSIPRKGERPASWWRSSLIACRRGPRSRRRDRNPLSPLSLPLGSLEEHFARPGRRLRTTGVLDGF